MQTALRWAAVLPAAAGAFYGMIFLSWFTLPSFVTGVPIYRSISFVIAHAIAAGVGVGAGAYTAPEYRPHTALALGALFVAFAVAAILLYPMKGAALLQIAAVALGALAGTVMVALEER